MFEQGTICQVLEGCSKLVAGTEVVIQGYSKTAGEYWCSVKEGMTCYWIKSELLERSGA